MVFFNCYIIFHIMLKIIIFGHLIILLCSRLLVSTFPLVSRSFNALSQLVKLFSSLTDRYTHHCPLMTVIYAFNFKLQTQSFFSLNRLRFLKLSSTAFFRFHCLLDVCYRLVLFIHLLILYSHCNAL